LFASSKTGVPEGGGEGMRAGVGYARTKEWWSQKKGMKERKGDEVVARTIPDLRKRLLRE